MIGKKAYFHSWRNSSYIYLSQIFYSSMPDCSLCFWPIFSFILNINSHFTSPQSNHVRPTRCEIMKWIISTLFLFRHAPLLLGMGQDVWQLRPSAYDGVDVVLPLLLRLPHLLRALLPVGALPQVPRRHLHRRGATSTNILTIFFVLALEGIFEHAGDISSRPTSKSNLSCCHWRLASQFSINI